MKKGFRITEEDLNVDKETFRIVIEGRGLKRYKQIKRLLDLLRMKWFE